MPQTASRRKFLRQATAAALVAPAIGSSIAWGYPANSKVRHAAVGVGNMGAYDLKRIASSPHSEVVALCDIDDRYLDAAAKIFPDARRYNDFRKMFDAEDKNIDSCNITTPDHMHAPITMTAIQQQKHVFCQKPLTHEIDEARKIRLAAQKAGVTTQLGTQIHSHAAYRTAVRLLRDGAIGRVREVHTWVDRAWSNNGRPKPASPPPYIHWDLWLGVAPTRPWGADAYHPKKWWSWLDFGSGNLGDMGSHLLDPVVSGLALGAPTSVRAQGDPPANETWPSFGKVVFEFPGTLFTSGPLRLTWYDGGYDKGHHPPIELAPLGKDEKLPRLGSIFLGERGTLLLPHVNTPRLLPEKSFEDFPMPEVGEVHHWHSFVDACRGEGTTDVNFSYAGRLTETVLLGNLARRFPGQRLEWNEASLKVTNFTAANRFLSRKYRKGWEIPGLI